jgi:hypothetical protein
MYIARPSTAQTLQVANLNDSTLRFLTNPIANPYCPGHGLFSQGVSQRILEGFALDYLVDEVGFVEQLL